MPLYLLENTIQKYDWGDDSAIPDFLGLPNPRKEPWAELWMGAHPLAPSIAWTADKRCSQRLSELILADPAGTLGEGTAKRFDGKLPFLFKVLSAAKPLSIQAHPSKRKAEHGFAREEHACIPLSAAERNYKDANHKPETIVALSDFEGLSGFRPIPKLLETIGSIGYKDWRKFAGQLEANPGKLELSLLFYHFITLKEPYKRHALRCVRSAYDILNAKGNTAELQAAYDWVIRLMDYYPDDIGALAPLMLNLFRLEPGQGLNLEAGVAHAYLRGTALEIMANSDNVIRGGLTHKHVDIPELMSVLSFESGSVTTIEAIPDGTGFELYPSSAPDYSLARARVDGSLPLRDRPAVPEILLCVDGSVRVDAGGERPLDMKRGVSVFVPAGQRAYALSGTGTVYRASVPA